MYFFLSEEIGLPIVGMGSTNVFLALVLDFEYWFFDSDMRRNPSSNMGSEHA